MKTKTPKGKTDATAPAPKLQRLGISEAAMITLTDLYADVLGSRNLEDAASLAVSCAELIQHHPALRADTKHLRALNAAVQHFISLSNQALRL